CIRDRSISALSEEKVSSLASDVPVKIVGMDSTDIDKLLFGYPAEGYGVIKKDPEKQMIDEDPLNDVEGYDPQQVSSASYASYDDSYAGSDWIDALTAESLENDMCFPGLNEVSVSDYKDLLGKISGLFPDGASKKKVTKALRIMAVKGSDSDGCRRTLVSTDQKIKCNIDSTADALERSTIASKNLLKQSRFLNRIRMKAKLSISPD
ncbi:MAG: hypothetical protein QUS09_10205, partial [Methanotrichaceae archaeon]|nr:hypothetical protein [Methanotrichaceae archaeon]